MKQKFANIFFFIETQEIPKCLLFIRPPIWDNRLPFSIDSMFGKTILILSR